MNFDEEKVKQELNEIWEKVKKETPGGLKKQVEKLEEVLNHKLSIDVLRRNDARYYYAFQGFLRDKKNLVK